MNRVDVFADQRKTLVYPFYNKRCLQHKVVFCVQRLKVRKCRLLHTHTHTHAIGHAHPLHFTHTLTLSLQM